MHALRRPHRRRDWQPAAPVDEITNKHLLPIYDKPMIFFPIQTLVDAGIRDIMIVTGGGKFACLGTASSSVCLT